MTAYQTSPQLVHSKRAAVIVAHPDDETIWGGGTILSYPELQWTIIALCRASDSDRAPRFFRAVQRLGASGRIGDLDDGPEQRPLPAMEVQQMVMSLLPATHYHLIVTHGPWGEYTRHRRHEETSRAVAALWNKGSVSATEVWMFAYEDGGKQYLPRPVETAHRSLEIPDKVWRQKYRIITQVYGFASDSFEAKAAPHKEAFWRFISQSALRDWSMKKGVSNEDSCSL